MPGRWFAQRTAFGLPSTAGLSPCPKQIGRHRRRHLHDAYDSIAGAGCADWLFAT
jgi:hypothetical protein